MVLQAYFYVPLRAVLKPVSTTSWHLMSRCLQRLETLMVSKAWWNHLCPSISVWPDSSSVNTFGHRQLSYLSIQGSAVITFWNLCTQAFIINHDSVLKLLSLLPDRMISKPEPIKRVSERQQLEEQFQISRVSMLESVRLLLPYMLRGYCSSTCTPSWIQVFSTFIYWINQFYLKQ